MNHDIIVFLLDKAYANLTDLLYLVFKLTKIIAMVKDSEENRIVLRHSISRVQWDTPRRMFYFWKEFPFCNDIQYFLTYKENSMSVFLLSIFFHFLTFQFAQKNVIDGAKLQLKNSKSVTGTMQFQHPESAVVTVQVKINSPINSSHFL